MRHVSIFCISLLTVFLVASCGSYKQNVMFKYDENSDISIPSDTLHHFTIHPFDLIELHVFTKNGEILIDPNNELIQRNISNNIEVYKPDLYYTVEKNGHVKLPMVNEVNLLGYTVSDAEEYLQKEYAKFYQQPFVKIKLVNKRVVLMGALGNKVIPMTNEEMRLTEVLAMTEILDTDAKVQNIRVLRDDQVFVVDLSTIEGYRQSNMIVRPGDIVYVEPVKRPFSQFLKDNGPLISIIASVSSLVAVIISIN